MPSPFFTIGHSSRTIPQFVELLRTGKVKVVVDIRQFPRSRANPQFSEDALPDALSEFQIKYHRIAALGGRRGRMRDVAAEVNGWWQNRSFHNYADYALSDEFRVGLDELIALEHQGPCAIMCSEAVWWRCHRRLVADQLIAAGKTVFHLMDLARKEPAELSAGAVLFEGVVSYPAQLRANV